MFIEVENNCLMRCADWKFSERATETNVNDNYAFDSGYELVGGVVQKTNPVLTYKEKRQAEYPSIPDQLDMIYWDQVNGTNLWQSKIAEIKAKYPKE